MATVARDVILIGVTIPSVLIAILVLAALGWWVSRRSACVFRIDIDGGEVRDIVGSAPQRFVDDVQQLCRFWQIDRGWIKGVRKGRRIVISVGGGIDQRHGQVFRNAWNYPVV